MGPKERRRRPFGPISKWAHFLASAPKKCAHMGPQFFWAQKYLPIWAHFQNTSLYGPILAYLGPNGPILAQMGPFPLNIRALKAVQRSSLVRKFYGQKQLH